MDARCDVAPRLSFVDLTQTRLDMGRRTEEGYTLYLQTAPPRELAVVAT